MEYKPTNKYRFLYLLASFLCGNTSLQRDGASKEKNQQIFMRGFCTKKASAAFTLIEVMVSLSIFSMVMLVSTGAVFSIVQANKKTHSIKSVMTNLNFALESMTRDIRLGSSYSCDSGGDCAAGDEFSFRANRDVNGGGYDSTDRIGYSLVGGSIQKEVEGLSSFVITSPEIVISSMKFYVIGTQSSPGDLRQPKVVIVIQGSAGTGGTLSNFNIQTTLTQRPIDS